MKIPEAHIVLCKEIIESWLKRKSNYIVVAPPMSASRHFFNKLSEDKTIFSFIGKELYSLAIAKMDTDDFRSEILFARKVANKWGVTDSSSASEDDPVTVLNAATIAVIEKNRIPIIIIHRFHEALQNLGERIGTVLRNLEHDMGLKTVVELPISLPVLRERWELSNKFKAPFLASDWGQGHRSKCLKGLNEAEISTLLKENGGSPDLASDVLKITGGLSEIVNDISEDLARMRRGGVEPYIKSRTKELCERLVDWLDSSEESHTYKKLVAKSLTKKLDPKEAATVLSHDWGNLILGKDGILVFKMLGWECLARLSSIADNHAVLSIEELISTNNYQGAADIIRLQQTGDSIDSPAWLLMGKILSACKILSNIFGTDEDWRSAKTIINELKLLENSQKFGFDESINAILRWEDLTDLMSDYFLKYKLDGKLRFEQYVCDELKNRGTLAFWQLLHARLENAKEMPAFQALQSVVTHPEAILQVYANEKFGICFWKSEKLGEQEVTKISDFIKMQFRPSANNAVLGFAELIFISSTRESELPPELRLVPNYHKMQEYLELYEVRKRQVHSTSFVSASDWSNYSDLCREMLERVSTIYGERAKDIALPSTDSILRSALSSLKSIARA
ncbi:hypothetical protein [Pseudomonas sp. WHRI 8519]|uniref:hypothetical protein n=1 Tax=Pseudomonas sp. WHRI 8519 TaxID=3162567 RepID=UPI0032EB1AF3